jgi:glycerophosphoryl diester phosphodiesterase
MRILCLIFFFSSPLCWSFDWQGHRGARGLYPENTIGSMKEALKYPVTTLELDVVISKDRQVVVSHEPWIDPEICKTPKRKNIFEMTYAEVMTFDCGSKPHPRFPEQQKVNEGKPLLSKLIKETKDNKISYNVEIKSTSEQELRGFQPDYKTFTDIVLKELLLLLPAERFSIQSFDWRVLKYLKVKHPQVTLSALGQEVHDPDKLIKELGFIPEIYSPHYKGLKADLVRRYQLLHMKVIPWTVNSVEEMRFIKSIGVDGIITDFPNLIEVAEQKSCPPSHNLFEGKCVKIPSHALPSDTNPGWVCKKGYQQKRSKCVKIRIPHNAHFLEDGKTWVCNEGYYRYRATCRKK